MPLDFIDRLTVVIEQGVFSGATLNIIDGMINSMVRTAVIFSLLSSFLSRNS
jgi:hypothetical protein